MPFGGPFVKIVAPEGIRIGEEVDSKSIAPYGVAGSSPVPSAEFVLNSALTV